MTHFIPLTLSLSKGCPSILASRTKQVGQGFDKLSLDGFEGVL
jgi:hypothetical protein